MRGNYSSIKAIIFDFDETLVQTKKSAWKALKETATKHYNFVLTDKQLNDLWGLPYMELLHQLMNRLDTPKNIKRHYENIAKQFPREAYPAAQQTVRSLMKKYVVSILSASGKDIIKHDLKELDFPTEDFFMIQTSEDTEVHKPNPEVFTPILNSLKALKIDRNECIYVGDSLDDLEASKMAGIKFIGLEQGNISKDIFEKNGGESLSFIEDLQKIFR